MKGMTVVVKTISSWVKVLIFLFGIYIILLPNDKATISNDCQYISDNYWNHIYQLGGDTFAQLWWNKWPVIFQ